MTNRTKGDRQTTTKSNKCLEKEMKNTSNIYIEFLTKLRSLEDLIDLFRQDCPNRYVGNHIKIINILNNIAEERICIYRDMMLDIQYTETDRSERLITNFHSNLIEEIMGAIKSGLAVPLDTIKRWEAAQNA